MSSTLGMMGINSDTLTLSNNLTVSNTTQTQNLTVSGTTSFPTGSIASSCISGGSGGLTLTNNTIDTSDYIHFTSQSTGAITTSNTNTNLKFNAVYGALTCNGLITTGNITAPTNITNYTASSYLAGNFGTPSGNIGNIVSGLVNGTTGNGTISTISLGVGVWIINGTINLVATSAGGYGWFLSISSTSSLDPNSQIFLGAGSTSIFLTITGNTAGGSLSRVVCNTVSTSYNFITTYSNGAPSRYAGNFYAVRIA